MEEQHLEVLKRLGFETSGKTYQEVVAELIEQHIQIMMEIETANVEFFKKEIRRLFKPTN